MNKIRGAWGLSGLAALLPCAIAGAQASEPSVRERVQVTGSHIRRVDVETGLPVTRMTREEIERSGALTTAELLERLPMVSAGGYSVAAGLGDSDRPGLAAISLRGLGSQSTLVLLNGRRLSPYAFNSMQGTGMVNLNQIPVSAIERIEVLRDGASAIYGTDAIGGVVNVILRKDYRGIDASALAASTKAGGGDSRKHTASLGWGDPSRQRFNVMAMLDYQKDTALRAADRAFARTAIRPDLGFAQTSGQVYPANFRGPNTGGLLNVTAAQGCLPAAGAYQVHQATGAPAPLQTFCRYDFTSVLEIYPSAERKAAFVRGVLQLAADHQALVEYHRAANEIRFAASETPVADFTGAGPMLYPAGGRHYPATITLPGGRVVTPSGDLQLFWRLKDAGLRTNRVETDEDRLLAGFRGSLAGWDYDAAASIGRSRARDFYEEGYVRESAFRSALATGLIDPFSGRPQTAEAMALIEAAKIRQKVRDSTSRVSSVDARISRELVEWRHGPVALALGVDHRTEELEERPEPVLYTGDILGGGGALPPTTRADRTIDSVFAEVNLPLARNLEAQLAVRHDRFSDFGGSTNPKLALRWNPAPELLGRASFGTGYRAPTLSDLFRPVNTDGGTALGLPDPARCPRGAPIGRYVDRDAECDFATFRLWYGGNAALQPESSRQWTLGLVYEPQPGVSLGVDYWTIRRRDSIQWITERVIFGSFAARDPLGALGHFVRRARRADGTCAGDGETPTPADAPCAIDHVYAPMENLGKYNVSGFDVSLGARASPEGWGTVGLRIEGTYFLRYRYQLERGGEYRDNVGRDSDNGVVARWKHVAAIDWRGGAWRLSLLQNFVLGNQDALRTGTVARRAASYETYDLRASWHPWTFLSLGVGVRNLFDRNPPAARTTGYFQVGYDPSFADPRGRTWQLAIKATLR